jgi:acetolactate synthase-1/2/3 large subunit
VNVSHTLVTRTGADAFLEGLEQIGVEYLFCNLGTDHAPLIEEMARWEAKGRKLPASILCPHENTAVHMAAGYAMATGRGQVAMIHVDAGTSNAALGLHNAFRARLPVMLLAGRAPYTLHGELPGSRDVYVHFVQDPFDQGSVVRPYVKWEYTLPSGVVAREALRRGHSMMQSDPKGPVYMMLPRETLAETFEQPSAGTFAADRYGPTTATGTDPSLIEELADRILAARTPRLVSSYAGRNPACFELVRELIEFTGMQAFEFNPIDASVPHDSPCFAGINPSAHVAGADFGLLLDVDVPWIPRVTAENPKTFWAHIDVDTAKIAFPMWGFPSNLRIQGDGARVLRQLLDVLHKRASADYRAKAAKRVEALARDAAKRRAAIAARAENAGTSGSLNPDYLCAALAAALDPEDVVLNEAVRNVGVVLDQMPRTRPGSLVGLAGGGLGFSGPMGLGIKLARPERTVVSIVGDGAFYFNNPASLFAVAKEYRLPIFMVILDNSGWAAVKEATLRMYPKGEAKARASYQARLPKDIDFAAMAQAAGAYAETLIEPGEVTIAIARCLAAVRSGTSAVLHAKVAQI